MPEASFPVTKVAIACNAGAYLDVSARITGTEGVGWQWGKSDQFQDVRPGQLTFTLDNYDGALTPFFGPTPLLQGQGVAFLLEDSATGQSRIVWGQITGLTPISSVSDWGRIAVVATDWAGMMNRTTASDVYAAMGKHLASWYWPLTDAAGPAVDALGSSITLKPGTLAAGATIAWQQTASTPTTDPMVTITDPEGAATATDAFLATSAAVAVPAWSQNSTYTGPFAIGFWMSPVDGLPDAQLEINDSGSNVFQVSVPVTESDGKTHVQAATASGVVADATFAVSSDPHYISVKYTPGGALGLGEAGHVAVFIDGTEVIASALGPALEGSITFSLGNSFGVSTADTPQVMGFSHVGVFLGNTVALLGEWFDNAPLQDWVQALCAITPGVTAGTFDSALGTSPVQPSTSSDQTVLSIFNDLVRGEQCYFEQSTTGTYTAPVTVLNTIARNRPLTPSLTLDAQKDLDGYPTFNLDVTNMFATVIADGPNSETVTYTDPDPTTAARVGSASETDTVLYTDTGQLLRYCQDRVTRGKNWRYQVAAVVIDTLTAQVATIDQLLTLTPGQLVEISNLPADGVLGITSWSGWFLGADELHTWGTSAGDKFTLYLAPILDEAVWDTSVWATGTETPPATVAEWAY